MNAVKEKLITDMINKRLQSIRIEHMGDEWMADVMNFGWVGYDKHTDEELIENAELMGLENIPTLEELQ